MASPPIRRRGGLVPRLVFAFAIALLVLEVGLRLLLGNGGQELVVQPARTREVCWQLEPLEDARFTGDAAPAGQMTRIHVNSLGARGSEPQGGAGRMRVVVLGDAFVLGPGVADDETLPARLGDELGRRGIGNDVLNIGVPGTSTSQQVAQLEARVADLHPDLVVLVVSPDDLDPGSETCPHEGVRPDDGVLSAGDARAQLTELLQTRLYSVRALALLREVGWESLVDPRGPWGPGRVRVAEEGRGPARSRVAAPSPRARVAANRTTPDERWGDVPILMPADSGVPSVVPESREEYVFVAAVQRLVRLGATEGFEVALVNLTDKQTFARATRCSDCRAPEALLSGIGGASLNLAQTWTQLQREPARYFQRAEGWPSAAGYAELASALAGDLAAWEPLRERR